MLTKEALIEKFGGWSRVYADAVVTTLTLYTSAQTQVSLRKKTADAADGDAEAILVVRCSATDADKRCYIDTNEINRLRSDCSAFKTQCTEVVVHTRQRKVEYTYVDPTKMSATDIEKRHFSYTWQPDPALAQLVSTVMGPPEKSMQSVCMNSRLCPADTRRVARIGALYMLSSAACRAYQIYVQNNGYTLIFNGLKTLSLSWCMHIVRQVELQVDQIRVLANEVHFNLKIPLTGPGHSVATAQPPTEPSHSVTNPTQPIQPDQTKQPTDECTTQGGPMRSRTRSSFLGRIKGLFGGLVGSS